MSNNQTTKTDTVISAQRFADLILNVGTYLLASGAHCGRIYSNVSRLANTWGFEVDINPTFKGLFVSVKDINNPSNRITCFKSSPPHNVNLSVLTDISHLSWKAYEENLSIDYVEKEFSSIKNSKGYNDFTTGIAVGLSCSGLCLFSNGDMTNALVALIGTFIGFIFKAMISKRGYNPMIVISISAFITTLVTGSANILDIGSNPEAAMATAVLYLVPGVPLINSMIDLIEGYLSSSINRALFAGFTLLCIAAGMTLCITLMGINNF